MRRARRATGADSAAEGAAARGPARSEGARRTAVFVVLAVLATATVVFDGGSPARADVDEVQGRAFGASVGPASFPLESLIPTPAVDGFAAEPDDSFGPVSDLATAVDRPGALSVSLLTATTQGGAIAGEDHFGFASSDARATGVVVFGGVFSAASVQASCRADGDGATGFTTLTGATFGGTALPTSPGVNTSVGSGSFVLTLNEQSEINRPGIGTSIGVNAIHITGTSMSGNPLDIIVGHVECYADGPDVLAPPPLAFPTVTTAATPTAVVGQAISDTATLTGGQNPTGTMTFLAFGPGDPTCAQPPIFTSTVPVAGNGDYPSGSFVPASPGTYLWVAVYSGDAGNVKTDTACGDPGETSVVSPPPSIDVELLALTAGQPEPGGTYLYSVAVTNAGTEALVLTSLTDDVYGDLPSRPGSTCATGGSIAAGATYECRFAGDFTGAAGSTLTDTVTAVAINPSGYTAADSDDATVSITARPLATTAVLTRATPTATVGQPVTDTATVAAAAVPPAPDPTGTVTFTLFDEATCSGPPIFTSAGRPLGTGSFPTAASDPFVPTAPGTYYWIAAYSGDPGHAPSAGACGDAGEVTTVSPVAAATPAISNRAPPMATVGSPISDVATLSGGQDPTGTITFDLYAPGDPGCAAAPVFSSSVPVPGRGDYASGTFTPPAAGTYQWVASYGGDANDAPVATACGDAPTAVTAPGLLTTVVGTVGSLLKPVVDLLLPAGPDPVDPSVGPITPPVVDEPPPPTPTVTDVGTTATTTTTTTTPPAPAATGTPGTEPPVPPGTGGTPGPIADVSENAAPAPPPAAIGGEHAGDVPVALIGAGVGALGLAAAGLLLVWLVMRRARRGAVVAPVGRRQRPRTHSEVADDLLGGRPGPDLARAGPATSRIADACGSDAVANPLIATLLWESFVTDPRFSQVLRTAGSSDRAVREGQVVVVRHAAGARHDLLVFDPGYTGKPVAVPVDLSPSASTAGGRRHRMSWPDLLASERGRPWPALDAATILGALQEAARATQFRLVVAALPKVLVTGCPTPGWPISLGPGSDAAATAGAVVEADDGTLAVTTVLHAVKGHEAVWVSGRKGRVLSTHEATDSCLIAVPDLEVDPSPRGLAGPLHGVSPRQYDPTSFDRIASGAKTTTVTSWDISILARQSFLGSKVYTTPDTVPGDSGAALIDSGDQILGFAVFRSAFGEPIEYSAWVWADQVFGAHEARLLGQAQDLVDAHDPAQGAARAQDPAQGAARAQDPAQGAARAQDPT